MYLVGIKEDHWVLITDGKEVYRAEDDVRYYSNTPIFTTRRQKRIIDTAYATNRIDKIDINTPLSFRKYCEVEDIEVKEVNVEKKLRKMAGPAALWGTIGAAVIGPVGAVAGAGIAGWLNSAPSNFCYENLREVFERAKSHYFDWKKIDEQKIIFDAEQEEQCRIKAEKNWRSYHRLKTLSHVDDLDGYEFEWLVADLYEKKGYSVNVTKLSGDYGVDIIAKKGNEVLAIQAKRYTDKVGVKAVQEALAGATYYKATNAVVVTNSFFTDPAKQLAERIGVKLINKKRLAIMWQSCHHNNDSIPSFDMAEYRKLEKKIKKYLYRVENASGKKINKRYIRH
jgi:restriction system protein